MRQLRSFQASHKWTRGHKVLHQGVQAFVRVRLVKGFRKFLDLQAGGGDKAAVVRAWLHANRQGGNKKKCSRRQKKIISVFLRARVRVAFAYHGHEFSSGILEAFRN